MLMAVGAAANRTKASEKVGSMVKIGDKLSGWKIIAGIDITGTIIILENRMNGTGVSHLIR